MRNLSLLLALLLSPPAFVKSQGCGTISLKHQYDIASVCEGITMTMKHDVLDRPYLYVASKEAGLKVYDISGDPKLVKTIPVSEMYGLHVMNLSQNENYLYLALGNSFVKANQAPGFAIIDVSKPNDAKLACAWTNPNLKGGGGIAECRGDYLYLGAMRNGLMIFDVKIKSKPELLSQLIPDIKYPDPHPDAKKYNARGMAVQNDLVYLCYDAGGLHIINVADKRKPVELGKYANPKMNGKPRAYNNIVVEDSIAYVTVDYVGLEVLNVSDPTHIRLRNWWNPWNPGLAGMNWFKSEGHANEIDLDRNNKLLFVSAGKTDLVVLDVSKPNAPQQCAVYGGPENELGTWGVSVYKHQVYLSYICAFIPFNSKWTGVKILTY